MGLVVISADRGLAGAYNASVIRVAERAILQRRREGQETALVIAGRKANSYFRYRGYAIDEAHSGFSEQPSYEDAREVTRRLIKRYEDGEIDVVEIVYTRFFSAGSQRVARTQLLPLDTGPITERREEGGPQAVYEFEPSPEGILELLLPRYVEARVFAAMLDAAASEQAARQRAMKSATDNADDLITRLTRVMNRARQDAITTEIMEIVGGAEALAAEALEKAGVG